jgi:iron complex outermembrane receptor protein
VLALAVMAGTSAHVEAQQALTELSLEELMRIDAGRVFGASERIQPVTEAPASVSFITAEEIARHGYRTLADILRSVRGLYVADDRNFSLLGARGFAKPGDYNSRILLLVNGHRVNDNVFGQAEIGAEFGLDAAMFERVEIIRGPASSIYGDSAFFAVINVITKAGESLNGGSLAIETGTLGTQVVRGSAGQRLANGVEVALSTTFENSAGVDKLYFPAFDSPATNHGIAEGLDGERVGQFYGQASYKNLTFTGAYGRRRRTVPTASFGTVFNEQDAQEQTVDRHTLADVAYARALGTTRLSVRGSFDRFTYDGTYPFATGEADAAALIGRNTVVGTRWSAGARVTRPFFGRQVVTVGAEFIDNIDQDQQVRYLNPASTLFSIKKSSVQSAFYLQDEIKLTPWLIFNGGARYDHYEHFVRVTPRAAIIAIPTTNQSFKYMYGGAFRAPNAYELNEYYFGTRTQLLRPESIDTHEVVWERYTDDWLRTSVSGYWYNADRLITLVADESSLLGTTFMNQGEVQAQGLEFEAQMRLSGKLQSVVSYELQRAKDVDTGTDLVNSPHSMAKVRLSVPMPLRESTLAFDVRYTSSRRTLAGQRVPGVATADMTLRAPLSPSFEIVGTLRNLFDADYAEPASDSHIQDAIPQNGRTARIGLRWNFWRK